MKHWKSYGNHKYCAGNMIRQKLPKNSKFKSEYKCDRCGFIRRTYKRKEQENV